MKLPYRLVLGVLLSFGSLMASDNPRLSEILASQNGKYTPAPALEFNLRDGLPNVFAKLKRGEPVAVTYFGTSVTRPPGWRVLSFEWLQRQFPQAKLAMTDASLGGTGSLAGVFRADRDLLPTKPDLVFIEFSGNDGGDSRSRPSDVLRSMEGIVRKLRRNNPQVEISLVYLPGGGDFKKLLAGEASAGMTLHELVAEHYGLPSICPSLQAAQMERDDSLVLRAPKTPDV